jgi:hypothetical protein
MKEIPSGIMHEPRTMAWAEITPLSEHKKTVITGPVPDVLEKKPLPVSRATTELRRAYPYIFDCAAYVKTQHPEKLNGDGYYLYFDMPYHVFIEFCLDYCNEQRGYLVNEIAKLTNTESGAGLKYKYIKISSNKTVYVLPVILAFSRTDLKTGKEIRLANIGQETKIEMVRVYILKELLDYSRGYIQVPKAFYAKTRRIYNIMRENVRPMLEAKDDYRALINAVKERCDAPIPTSEAVRYAETIIAQAKNLEAMAPENGGFYKVYLALEYILANKKKDILSQKYDFLKLCEKCAPQYTQAKDGKLYLDNRNQEALRYGLLMSVFIDMLPEDEKRIIGISRISAPESNMRKLQVSFFQVTSGPSLR